MHVPDFTRFGHVDFVFCQLNMSHLQNQRLRGMFGVGVRAKKACGKEADDSQHGTGKGICMLPEWLPTQERASIFLL
jgi:hypothetical protein